MRRRFIPSPLRNLRHKDPRADLHVRHENVLLPPRTKNYFWDEEKIYPISSQKPPTRDLSTSTRPSRERPSIVRLFLGRGEDLPGVGNCESGGALCVGLRSPPLVAHPPCTILDNHSSCFVVFHLCGLLCARRKHIAKTGTSPSSQRPLPAPPSARAPGRAFLPADDTCRVGFAPQEHPAQGYQAGERAASPAECWQQGRAQAGGLWVVGTC